MPFMGWLFSWGVTSVVVAAFAGFGLAFVSSGDFRLAKLCFLLVAADAIGGMVMWGINTSLTTWFRTITVFVVTGALGVLLVLSFRYVDGKKEAEKSKTPLPPYKVHIDATMFSPRRDRSCMIFIAYQGLHGETLSPVNAAVFLTIVNDQPFPIMLSDYSLEMRTADDSWAPIIRLSAVGMTIYMGSDISSLARVSDNSVFLDNVIAGRKLLPHDPVRGWSLFEYPNGYGPTFVPEFRVTLKDYEGTKYTTSILTSSPRGTTSEGAQIQGFPLAAGKFDLSKAFLKYWSDPVV